MTSPNRPPDDSLVPPPTLIPASPEASVTAAPASGERVYADDVFDEVVGLSPDAREEALLARCRGDRSLLAEVRALLAACDAAGSAPHEPTDLSVGLQPGQRLGPWILSDRLGTGASGSVWKAFDSQLEAWSALKVVHLRDGSAPLDAVLSEARAASRIISDHVVRVKRAGRAEVPEQPGGVHYVEMELCAEHRARADGGEELVVGQTLADIAPDGQAEAVRLVLEAARGVDAAHRIGVLHRDVKPANILVTPVSRRALVADFGLSAPHVYPPPGPETPATATVTVLRPLEGGVLVGTPSYMAPEQAFGHPPKRTSDVYGLGATLYALLAEAPPYAPRPGAALPALDVVAQVQEGPPPSLTTVAPKVPRRLVRIVERAMARSARHRYPTAAALAEDLALYLADRPTSVDGPDPLLRIALFARRNAAVVTATAVMALVVAVFGVAVWRLDALKQEIEQQMIAAQLRRDEAEHQAALAEGRAAVAETARRNAEDERADAISDAKAAIAARQRAEQGAQQAETRARYEIEQRWAAEEEKVRAEQRLEGETDLRVQMQDAMRKAQERYTDERLAREWVEVLLADENRARRRAEHERDVVQGALDEADARLVELHTRLEEAQAELERSGERLAAVERASVLEEETAEDADALGSSAVSDPEASAITAPEASMAPDDPLATETVDAPGPTLQVAPEAAAPGTAASPPPASPAAPRARPRPVAARPRPAASPDAP